MKLGVKFNELCEGHWIKKRGRSGVPDRFLKIVELDPIEGKVLIEEWPSGSQKVRIASGWNVDASLYSIVDEPPSSDTVQASQSTPISPARYQQPAVNSETNDLLREIKDYLAEIVAIARSRS